MRACLVRIGSALLIAMAGFGPAAGQQDIARLGAVLEGAWHGKIEGTERPYRYLEILSILPTGSGSFSAGTLFGWADGTIGWAPASVAADGPTVTLSLTAGNGTKVRLSFDGSGVARGVYQAVGKPEHPVRFARLADRPDFDWLNAVWSASRNNQTRIFDIKHVVGTKDGAVIAIGQYGIVEEPDKIRQMVATVDGDPANARIRWRTQTTAAELRRVNPSELSGSFETSPGKDRQVDPIVFRQQESVTGLPQPAPRAVAGIGQQFPDFTLKTMAGETVRLSDFRGKVVVLNFFQIWDAWRGTQTAALRTAKARYGDKLAILTVSDGTTRPAGAPRSGAGRGQDLETFAVENAPATIKKTPAVWVIDPKGIIVEKTNYVPQHKLVALLEKAMQ